MSSPAPVRPSSFGLSLFSVAFIGVIMRLRSRLYTERWFLRLVLWMLPVGVIATIAGWMVSESGRQPWLVYGKLMVNNSASSLSTGELIASLAASWIVYLGLITVWVRQIVAARGCPAASGAGRRRPGLPAFPGLLLLDEPTEGLDHRAARALLENLRPALPGTTIVAAIHDHTLDHLPVPADATIQLAAGRVLRVRRLRPMDMTAIPGEASGPRITVGLLPGRGTARRRPRRRPAPASPGPGRRLPLRPAPPWPFRSPRGHLRCRPP